MQLLKWKVLCLLVPFVASCTAKDGDMAAETYRVLDTVAVGAQSVQVYVASRRDVVVFGFGTRDGGGTSAYCPLFVSIEGSVPPVTLTVSVIESRQEVWVESSWPDAAVLGNFHPGDAECTTMYGSKPLIDDAIPQDFGGSLTPIQVPEKNLVTKTVTIRYPERTPPH